MNSPVEHILSSSLKINRKADTPVYLQIVYQMINLVQRQRLAEGTKIPGSRRMAQHLNVHRQTVVAALEELQTQGWLDVRANVGSFILNPEDRAKTIVGHSSGEKAPFDFQRNYILDYAPPETAWLQFTDGTADSRLFNTADFLRLYRGVLKRKETLQNLSQQKPNQDSFLQNPLCFYLNATQNLHLSPENLLILNNREEALTILAHLLICTGDKVLTGDPGFYLPNMIFNQAGAKIETLPVDSAGICVEEIADKYTKGAVRLLYLNPLAHYPTGVRLSEKRSVQLHNLARELNLIVVEDYSDFDFSEAATNSLFQTDNSGFVLSIGDFGSYLPAGFQRSFILGPQDFLQEAKKYQRLYGKQDFLLERALALLIEEGDIHRYQRKAQKTTAERKVTFAKLLSEHFREEIRFQIPKNGLAFWIHFPQNLSLSRLKAAALELGLLIPQVCLYQNRKLTALRLGFAHLNEKEMHKAVQLLKTAYDQVKS